MYNLSYTQAVAMMEQGCKVKHEYFTGEEYFHMPANNGGRMVDEAGYPMDSWFRGEEWQNDGWMVVEDHYEWKEDEVRLSVDERKEISSTLTEMDFSFIEERVLAHFSHSIKEMCRDVEINFKTPEVMVKKPGCFDYTQHKIKKGKGHNKLQKRKKK
ncbi:hypothetical protein [Klebsiella phage 05F01]|nr:hypothetical protein [Klebsiella phage 05F01]